MTHPDYDLPPIPMPPVPEKQHDWPRIIGALVALTVVGWLALMVTATPSTQSPAPAAPATQAAAAPALPADNGNGWVINGEWHTAEYWLSIIDSSTSEQDYRYLLDALQAKFPGLTRHQISDYLVKGQELLREKGINESIAEFGWHVDECVPKEMAGPSMKFPEVAALYLTLRRGER